MYFFLSGNVTYEIEGKEYALQYGDSLFIPPNTSHRPVFHSGKESYQRFVLWISQEYYNSLCAWSPEFSYTFRYVSESKNYRLSMDCIPFQDLQGKLLNLLEEIHGSQPFHQLSAKLQIHSFLLFINHLTYQKLHQEPLSYESALYLNLCNYINSHLEENLSLDQLAAFFYSSKYHISHVFKEHMGISLHQYILKKRLGASKNAILSGIPLNELCHRCGFKDYTSFYRAFKKEFGLSPKEFREQAPNSGTLPKSRETP